MSKIIHLDSGTNYQTMMRDIGRLGVLRLDQHYEKNGITYVKLHERTLGEWLKERLFAKPKDLAKSRQDVANALASIIKSRTSPHEQLIQNIRDRVAHNVDITGRALKRDHQPLTAGKNPLPLQGGMVAARGAGFGVRVLGAPPASIKCDHVILRDSSALNALRAHHKDQIHLMNSLTAKSSTNESAMPNSSVHVKGAPAGTWSCIPDVAIPPTGKGHAQLSTEDLQASLAQALKGKQGAVVVELLPDSCTEKAGVKEWHYSDAGIKAQWQVAQRAVEAAKTRTEPLVISFVCDDVSQLERMKALISQLSPT